ncbi:unnamed protein product [Durusdinium trenchii]|uniref:GH18 domain-containing protein n=1 Tax=Durusdinium trenchii TaxID=1381693 RepID=A0ABP0MMP2_9DINO
MAGVLRTAALMALVQRVCAIAVVGYVPDYRFNSIDWRKAVARTTHLILFSVEPKVDGLQNLDTIRGILRPQSALSVALEQAGADAPKVLVSVGGAGRSADFGQVLGSKKSRKRLAKQLLSLLQELPQLSGLDFDVEVQNPDWLNLAKLVLMLRTAIGSRGGEMPVMTMTFHALSAAMKGFAPLTLKPQDSEEKRFVDLFDMCHAMTYTVMDQQGRHASEKMDTDVVEAWAKLGLPAERLTLGIPLFAVKNGAVPATYQEIVTQEPSIISSGQERTKEGFFFVNAASAAKKVQLAEERGIAGLMIWELGQDVLEDHGNILREVWNAAKNKGFLHRLLGFSFKEVSLLRSATAWRNVLPHRADGRLLLLKGHAVGHEAIAEAFEAVL